MERLNSFNFFTYMITETQIQLIYDFMSQIRVYTSEIFTSPPPIEEEEEDKTEKEEKIVEKKIKEDAKNKLSEIAKKIIEEAEKSNDFSFFLCNEILPHLPLSDINIIRTNPQYHAKIMLYFRIEHIVKYHELPQNRREFHTIFTTLLKKEASKTQTSSPRCQFSLEANTVQTFFKEENTSENQLGIEIEVESDEEPLSPPPRFFPTLEEEYYRRDEKQAALSSHEEIEVVIDREPPPLSGAEETFLYHPRKRPATSQERTEIEIEIENSLPPSTPFRNS